MSKSRARLFGRPVGAALLLGIAVLAHGGDKMSDMHPVSLADLEAANAKVDDVTIDLSPDGRALAYARGSSLTIRDIATGSVVWNVGDGFLPLWSPDGKRLAFYSARGSNIQLFVADLAARDVSKVTDLRDGIDPDPTGRINGVLAEAFRYSWSPDGTQLVFSSRAPAAAVPTQVQHATTGSPNSALPLVVTLTDPPFRAMQGVFYQPIYDADSMQSTDGRTISANSNHSVAVLNSQLFVVDTRTHITRQLTANGSSYFNPSWFPGAHIICAHVDGGGPVFRAKATNIITVEPESGLILERTRGDGIKYRPTWSADGTRFAFLASQHAFSQVGVYVGSRLNENITYASSRLDRQIYDYRWSSHGDQILLRYRDGVSTPFSAIDLGSGRLTEIATTRYGDSPRSVAAIAAARSGVVAWLQRDVGSDGVLRYRTPGKPIRDLIDLYPEMQAWKRGQVRIVRWTNTQGDEKEGTLLTPVGYQIGRRYPLIVDAYPLVGGSTWTQPLGGNQAWASQGYAVFRPSPRAPIAWLNGWKSQASSLAGKGPGGWEVTVDDVLSGVDELIRTGIVDADRMCLYGHSSGGGVVDYLVTRTNRFKCAVSVAPALSDWVRRALFETDAGWLVDWAGVSLWDDTNAYVALSAVFRANLVRTPMLIAVGDKDNPCLLDSIEMYNGLRTAGVNVSLVRYPDQGHVFTGEALNDFWNRETMFFARYLMQ